jgi:hypothetical protein
MNLHATTRARQPTREAWPRERLVQERAIALNNALDKSTGTTYSSHLQSYLSFCKLHNFPNDPTPDTLSFYIVYMAKHISPKSLPSYLSGIASKMEHVFPDVRKNMKEPIVRRTLHGCMRLNPTITTRKRPLEYTDLNRLLDTLTAESTYEDVLFAAILFTGFYGLMRLGELVYPDRLADRSIAKVILRSSVQIEQNQYQFHLPAHKADRFFQGNVVLIQAADSAPNPVPIFRRYLDTRDTLFPHHLHLFLRANGDIPTRSWFIERIKAIFPDNVAGHSLRSGGATALAIAGVPDNRIQAIGRWSSDAFQIYIRKHPVLVHTLMTGRAAFSTSR